jgi:tetratricopeptide (TPR) repeat protein
VQSYRRALDIDPSTPQVHFALAITLQRLGRLDEAITALREAIAVDSTSIAAHTQLAEIHIGRNQLDEALVCVRRTTEIEPASAEAWSNLGTLLSKLGRPGDAIDALTRAVALKPRFAGAHVALGRAFRESGRPHDAVACFRRAIDVEPDGHEAYADLGYALRDIGQVAEARAPFDRAVQLRPTDARARTGLGSVLHELGLPHEAIEHHRVALHADAGLAEVRNNLGNALKDAGRVHEAIEEYERVIRERPKFWSAHSNLLLTMNYAGSDPSEYLDRARAFGRALEAATPSPFASWSASANPKRLRVGFVSGDLRAQPGRLFSRRRARALPRFAAGSRCVPNVRRGGRSHRAHSTRIRGVEAACRPERRGRGARDPRRWRPHFDGSVRAYRAQPAAGIRVEAGARAGGLARLFRVDGRGRHGLCCR